MLQFLENKKVIIKRYSTSLGEYNRPKRDLTLVGTYFCHVAETSSNTSQLQPQKKTTTELTLYLDPNVDVKMGDVLYIYEIDEYEEIIRSTEFKALADKPYKKRTHLAVPLLSEEEI